MKKFVAAMVIIIIVGAILAGVGCAVFFTSDFRTEPIEYTEGFFETETECTKLDFELADMHNVVLERGEKWSVKYFDSTVSKFSVSAQNGSLVVTEKNNGVRGWLKHLFFKTESTDVVVTVPEGELIDITGEINGSATVNLPDWNYGNMNITVHGASTVNASGITAKSISVDVSGAAKLVLSGSADKLRAHASGSVKMDCNGFNCPDVDVYASGSAELNLSGTGNILSVHASGSGRVWARNFAIDRAEIIASGSVNAELNVSTLLKVDVSGSANIAYWGDPQVDKDTSGSATIVKKS